MSSVEVERILRSTVRIRGLVVITKQWWQFIDIRTGQRIMRPTVKNLPRHLYLLRENPKVLVPYLCLP